jgi:hypothetical protein
MEDEPRPDAPAEPGYDVIDESPRYVLGLGEGYYGLWDKQAGDEPLARFDVTDDGFSQAESRFGELKRSDRQGKGLLLQVLRAALIAGLGVWIVSGAIFIVLAVRSTTGFSSEGPQTALNIVRVIDFIASRIWLAAGIGLVAIWLLERVNLA